MRSTTFSIAFVLIVTLSLRVHACFSEGRRVVLMTQYQKLARELGFKESEINCLLSEGDKYEPKRHEYLGRVVFCIHDLDYQRHMVSSMSKCISQLKPVAVRMLADGTRDLMQPKMEERVLRRPVEPTTPMRKVAHWLGLKTTERGTCHCTSGCHYCCVNTGLGGDDMCFRVWCAGKGYCR